MTNHTLGPIEQVLDDARKALVQWENLCAEFLPGHYKLRPEFSDCEVASHQAQVSIRQLGGSLDALLAENARLREALTLAQATIERLTVKHAGGFSSTQGTLDVIRAALAVERGAA